jgi:hypothetical protein
MAEQAAKAAAIGNVKELNRITKVLANKKFNRRKQNKDINCKLLTTEREQIKMWHEYFSEVLNPQIETDPEASRQKESEEDIAGERIKININLPSKKEIMQCIKEIKMGEAPGPDNINIQILKASPELIAQALLPLFKQISQAEMVPNEEEVLTKVLKRRFYSLKELAGNYVSLNRQQNIHKDHINII